MKLEYQVIVSIVGGAVAALFGGWDMALTTLVIFMCADYVTGLVVAGVFKKSKKSESGALESRAGWKGLCRKGLTLLVVLIATRLDALMGTDFVRDAVVIGYVVNEGISIIENAGLAGVKINPAIQKAFDVLKGREEQ